MKDPHNDTGKERLNRDEILKLLSPRLLNCDEYDVHTHPHEKVKLPCFEIVKVVLWTFQMTVEKGSLIQVLHVQIREDVKQSELYK